VEQSPVAGGTGGAGTARAGDPSAAWYNPAAAAAESGLAVAAGILIAVPMLHADALDGSWSEEVSHSARTPPHLYLSYTYRPFAAGVSVNVPFGSGVAWPEDWPGRFESVSTNLQVFRIAPFVAWRFGRFRLGAGIHVDLATLKIRRQLDFVDTEGKVAIDLHDAGLGGHAAIHVDLTPWLALGATYKSRTVLRLEGGARFNAPLAFTDKAQDQNVSATYTMPDLVTVGLDLRPHRRWRALLDLGFTVWSVYEELLIDFEREQTTDARQETRWRPRISVRGGAEFRALPWLITRLGAFYDPSPVPADTLSPTSPDSTRIGVTAGLGVRLPWRLSVDLFYAYVQMLGQESDNPELLDASYGGGLHLMGLGVGYGQR
jgi:long-chain fatty acid transport protein